MKVFRAGAELEVVNQILSTDSATTKPASSKPRASESELPDVSRLLVNNIEDLDERVEKLDSKDVNADSETLRELWIKLRKKRNEFDVKRAAVLSDQPTELWLALLGRDSWNFWLAGTLAIAALAFVSWHDGRHEYRRALNGSKARSYGLTRLLKWAMCVLIVVAATAVCGGKYITRYFGKGNTRDAVRTIDDMADEIAKVQNRQVEAEAKLKEADDKLDAKIKELMEGTSGNLRLPWERLVHAVVRIGADTQVDRLMMRELTNEAVEVANLNKFIERNQSKVASLNHWKWAISGGIGIILSSLTVVLGLALLASIKRREYKTKYTCPMCLGYKTLVPESSHCGNGINDEGMMLRCNGRINDPSGQGETDCTFTFEPFYQSMDKLCFPTLGFPGAGKTHWLAMVYRELNAGRFDNSVQFEKVETESSKEFDKLVRQIINLRMDPRATQQGVLPHPVVFNFCDNDRWGRSNLLVNVFDYSGEVTAGDLATRTNAHRRRALHADGYFFFLDLTKPRDMQEEALNRFRRDVRVLGNVKSNHSLRTPIALCMSKIDLISQHLPDASFVRHFYDELQRIDPSGQGMSQKIIEERSNLAQELRDIIWPNWNIERLISDLFGGRFMFFPLSPKTLGSPDLAVAQGPGDTATDPFGILEPFVWLLHMNGYPVLKRE